MATTRLSSKFNRCVKSVRRTVRARKGSNKESAAIAICTKSVLQTRGRTMKRYSKKRLLTQKKFRGGLFGLTARTNEISQGEIAAKQVASVFVATYNDGTAQKDQEHKTYTVNLKDIAEYQKGLQYIIDEFSNDLFFPEETRNKLLAQSGFVDVKDSYGNPIAIPTDDEQRGVVEITREDLGKLVKKLRAKGLVSKGV